MLPHAYRPKPVSATANGKASADPNAYPYVDTPQFCYSDWLKDLETQKSAIGSAVPSGKTVLIIGAGISGACAAYELAKAGVKCVVVDAESDVGGRCASTAIPANPFFNKNLVELGAMRFPASESIMDFYVKDFKIFGGASFVDNAKVFPDPGKVPTMFGTDGKVLGPWKDGGKLPDIFTTVHDGWIALVTQPLVRKVGSVTTTFTSMPDLRTLLQNGKVKDAQSAWQQWVDTFEQMTFYGAMFDIMTGRDGWVIPGGTAWSFDDFDRFGQLGVGSGGFGALYSINFPEIMRLVVDGLEDTQYFFPPGIRTLPRHIMNAAVGNDSLHPVKTPAELYTMCFVTKVLGGKDNFTVNLKNDASGSHPVTAMKFNRVLVATTTRSMECTMNVANAMAPQYPLLMENGQCAANGRTPIVDTLINADTANAVRRVHNMSSIKVAAQIKKFWKDKDQSTFPRCFLSDDIIHQVYTLDYGEADTAVAFISYTWDDDSVRQQGLGVSLDATTTTTTGAVDVNYAVDKQKLYRTLHQRLLQLAGQNPDNTDFIAFVNGLYPYSTKNPNPVPARQDYPLDAILYVEWQSLPTYNAAFKLSQPGQDKYVQNAFYDYQKAGSSNDTGVFLAGDTLAWTSGWIEGGLYTGLNAAAGLVASLGGKVTSIPQTARSSEMVGSPMEINKSFFNYFVPGSMQVPDAGESKFASQLHEKVGSAKSAIGSIF